MLLKWALILSILLASAISVIYSKHVVRERFIKIQTLTAQRDELEIQWGQLQLELTTLADHNRVELKARHDLGLITPEIGKIIYIKL